MYSQSKFNDFQLQADLQEMAEESKQAVEHIKTISGDDKSTQLVAHLVILSAASTQAKNHQAAERYLRELCTVLTAMKAREEKDEYSYHVLQMASVASDTRNLNIEQRIEKINEAMDDVTKSLPGEAHPNAMMHALMLGQ